MNAETLLQFVGIYLFLAGLFLSIFFVAQTQIKARKEEQEKRKQEEEAALAALRPLPLMEKYTLITELERQVNEEIEKNPSHKIFLLALFNAEKERTLRR